MKFIEKIRYLYKHQISWIIFATYNYYFMAIFTTASNLLKNILDLWCRNVFVADDVLGAGVWASSSQTEREVLHSDPSTEPRLARAQRRGKSYYQTLRVSHQNNPLKLTEGHPKPHRAGVEMNNSKILNQHLDKIQFHKEEINMLLDLEASQGIDFLSPVNSK